MPIQSNILYPNALPHTTFCVSQDRALLTSPSPSHQEYPQTITCLEHLVEAWRPESGVNDAPLRFLCRKIIRLLFLFSYLIRYYEHYPSALLSKANCYSKCVNNSLLLLKPPRPSCNGRAIELAIALLQRGFPHLTREPNAGSTPSAFRRSLAEEWVSLQQSKKIQLWLPRKRLLE